VTGVYQEESQTPPAAPGVSSPAPSLSFEEILVQLLQGVNFGGCDADIMLDH